MLSISELFMNRKRLFLIGVVCVLLLLWILRTNPFAPAGSPEPTASSDSSGYQAAVLMQFKSKYVGDHVNVGNLLRNLPYGEFIKKGISLQTEKTPYGISVNYSLMQSNNSGNSADNNTGYKPGGDTKPKINQVETILRNNAVVIFALIDNVDIINITADLGTQNLKLIFSRTELQKSYPRDLRDYAKTQGELQILLNSLRLKILVYPQKYALTMSSTPGIRLLAQYEVATGQVQYSADKGNIEYSASSGQLQTWDNADGKITEKGTRAEFPSGTPAYWSPFDMVSQFGTNKQSEIPISITVSQNGPKVAEKQVIIHFDGSTFFTVDPSGDVIITDSLQLPSPNPDTIDEAVSRAVKSQGKSYLVGEVVTEGHIILDTEEKDGQVKVYTIASIGWFGFENGIFTTVSGSGTIPTVITFSKNESGAYDLLQYQEPKDGALYLGSVKKMFPQKLWPEVLTEGKRYSELVTQKDEQAVAYLKSIGREAKVSASYVEKKLVDINVEASNKLFAELTKYNSFLNSCPYWIGSTELVENGVRYIYKTSQSKTADGYDLVIFQKNKEDGSIVTESKYKIVGNKPQLID